MNRSNSSGRLLLVTVVRLRATTGLAKTVTTIVLDGRASCTLDGRIRCGRVSYMRLRIGSPRA